MRTIEITETDFGRLQKAAVPLVDTSATAISRLLDYYEQGNGTSSPATSPNPPDHGEYERKVLTFGIEDIPPVVHTRLLSGRFNGRDLDKVKWNNLVELALLSVLDSHSSPSDLARISGANIVQGEKQTDGYKYVPNGGFSYQGVSAQGAIDIVVRCAKTLRCEVRIEFEWRDKDNAYRPGERAILTT